MKKFSVFEIVFCAVMASLAIVLEKFVSLEITTLIKLTFYGLPLLIVGVLFGFKHGLITGLVCGVTLQLTSKYGVGPTSIFWALAPISWGAISGLVFEKMKCKNELLKIVVSVVCASISATILNTIAMMSEIIIMNDEYYTYATILTNLPFRLLSMVILIVPYTIILKILVQTIKPLFSKKHF